MVQDDINSTLPASINLSTLVSVGCLKGSLITLENSEWLVGITSTKFVTDEPHIVHVILHLSCTVNQ